MRRLGLFLGDWGPVLALAVIAAAGSFTHIKELAEKSGQHGWMAWAIAVSIDLTCVMAARERHRDAVIGRRRAGWVSWPTLVLVGAVALTLAANLATAQPTVWGWIMAGVPAAAFLVAVSMLERRAARTGPASGGEPDPGSGTEEFEHVRWEPVETAPAPEPEPAPVPPAPTTPAVEQGNPLADYAARIAAEYRAAHGGEITVTALRSRLGVSEAVAVRLREQVTA